MSRTLGLKSVALVRHLILSLSRNARGAALPIMAAAMVPLVLTMGAGVDISRAYLAQDQMQNAVDLAAIAGRRAMTGEDLATAMPDARKFFAFNFPKGSYGVPAVTPVITKPDVGTVAVSASTEVPTTLMALFGIDGIPISAKSQVTQNFVNTDIELVLDTTGSMAYSISGNTSCYSGCRIDALRSAVLALYDQLKPAQDELAKQGLRLRYGIMPYSSTVNVGKLLYATNSSYIRTTADYYYCYHYSYDSRGRQYCDTVSRRSVKHDSSWLLNNWSGCIEERQTTSAITSKSGYTIPSAAYDLNVDLLPTNDASRWPPYDTNAETANSQVACPAPAKLLQTWDRSSLSTYLNTLNPDGGTYHDLGMIWGTRAISSGGVFGPNNPATYADRPVNKVVIFMTDGLLDTGPSLYSAYGTEQYDHRVAGSPYPSQSEQNSRHRQRFKMMCNAAKGKNISIWVVSFASSLDADLTECASSPSQASTVADKDALIKKFIEIGRNIGSLRIEK